MPEIERRVVVRGVVIASAQFNALNTPIGGFTEWLYKTVLWNTPDIKPDEVVKIFRGESPYASEYKWSRICFESGHV